MRKPEVRQLGNQLANNTVFTIVAAYPTGNKGIYCVRAIFPVRYNGLVLYTSEHAYFQCSRLPSFYSKYFNILDKRAASNLSKRERVNEKSG